MIEMVPVLDSTSRLLYTPDIYDAAPYSDAVTLIGEELAADPCRARRLEACYWKICPFPLHKE